MSAGIRRSAGHGLVRAARASWRGILAWTGLALALSCGVGFAPPARLHPQLASSSPAAGDTVEVAPDTIRLTFTEGIEATLSTMTLVGPGGEVELAPVESAGSNLDLRARPVRPLAAGDYIVRWRAVGTDGHTVTGEFTFTVAPLAAGASAGEVEADTSGFGEGAMAPEGVATMQEDAATSDIDRMPPLAEPASAGTVEAFSANSPLYAAVRWLELLGTLGVAGALGFAFVLAATARGPRPLPAGFQSAAAVGASGIGAIGATLLLVSIPLRLQAQAFSVFGEGVDVERAGLLFTTLWGRAWILQLLCAVAAIGALLLVRRFGTPAWAGAAVATLGLVLAPALSGHAAAVEPFRALAVASDALHLLSAGVWLGTLCVIFLVALPLVSGEPDGDRGRILVPLIEAFSPLALVAGGLLVATGIFGSVLQLQVFSDLWTTNYGRILQGKVFFAAIVFAAGAYNWRRLRPRLSEPDGAERLRSSAGFELAVAIVVLGITAFLVASPTPVPRSDQAALAPVPAVSRD